MEVDRSAQKKIWKKLQCSEQRYRSLFENHPDAIFSTDLQGNFLSANTGFERLTGRTGKELLELPYARLVEANDLEKAVYHFRQAMQGIPQYYEIVILHKTGHHIDVHVTNVPIIIAKKVVGMFGIVRNVSLEKRLWKELRQSEERYRSLVEDLPDAFMICVADKWVYVNEAAVKLLGASNKADILNRTVFDMILPEYHELVKQRILMMENNEITVDLKELKVLRFDGEVVDVEVSGFPTVFEGKAARYVVIRDITERKRTQELLQQSDKLSMIGELAAGIAHEIRNPLTSLRGFVQLFRAQTETHKEYLEIMLSEIDRINSIVSELLLLAKPKKMKLEQKDLQVLLESVVALLSPQAILHDVEILLHVDADVPLITCEENKLKQVFINLVKNAVEAMPEGGKIQIRAIRENQQVVIQVIDEGCGIPKDQIPKVGQAFFTTKEKGTGLGLMTCLSIVTNHRGTIQIESEEHSGTTVEVRLPLL